MKKKGVLCFIMDKDLETALANCHEDLLRKLVDLTSEKSQEKQDYYRRQLVRTIVVLERTKSAFKSKQLKALREEIVTLLQKDNQ